MKIVKGKHIGVYGVIENDNKIVLIKKARGGYLGKLDLPGGGMEYAEEAFETLKRELREEVGVVVKKGTLLDVKTNTIKWQMETDTIEDLYHIGILYKIDDFSGDIKTTPDGIDSLGANWYEINKLDLENLTPFAKFVISKYYK